MLTRSSVGIAFLLMAAPVFAGEERLVHEGIVDAPLDQAWAALATKAGQESWNVAHAEVELKVGGRLRTHYSAAGQIGDAGTIEQTILSFDPQRMLSFRVVKPPEKFPFKEAIQKMWTVIYFEPVDAKRTKVTVVCLGFGDDEESQKMRKFFNAGNAYTIKQLQKKFAAK